VAIKRRCEGREGMMRKGDIIDKLAEEEKKRDFH
jgi:hypothetical protein